MTETKMALMDRLRKERRWEEADQFREQARARLKNEGMRRGEAREEAWRLTAEKYPKVVKSKPQQPTVSGARIEAVNAGIVIEASEEDRRQLVELAQTPGAWTTDLTEALKWVNSKWSQEVDVSPSEAPNVLDWLLWKFCMVESDRFVLFSMADYLLRHGEMLSSIVWLHWTQIATRTASLAAKRREAGPGWGVGR